MTLNAIKARLNSVSPTKMAGLPQSVLTLLEEDLPKLLEVAEAGLRVRDSVSEWATRDGLLIQGLEALDRALVTLETKE